MKKLTFCVTKYFSKEAFIDFGCLNYEKTIYDESEVAPALVTDDSVGNTSK